MLLEKWLLAKQSTQSSNFNLYLWGAATGGLQANLDTLNDRSSPTQLGTSWSSVSIGFSYGLAIDSNGQLYAWGVNATGQLGLGDTINRSSPVQVTSGVASWSQVAASRIDNSSNHSMAITSQGLLYGWGDNTYGELGTNDAITRSAPVQVGTSSWAQVNLGVGFTYLKDINGVGWAVGRAQNWAQLGDLSTIGKSNPTQITTLRTEALQNSWLAWSGQTAYSWTQLSVGYTGTSSFAGAIRNDGKLFVWGDGANGQLGNNANLTLNSPVAIGTSSWLSISAGANNSNMAGITVNGQLFVWGDNQSGQLGQGDTISRSNPTQVGTSSWAQVSIRGLRNVAAITATGALFTWGYNLSGQLGTNESFDRSSPIQIGTSSWSLVDTGQDRTPMATTAEGYLFGWGNNNAGQLADNSVIAKSSPVQISTIVSEADQTNWIAYSGATARSWAQISVGDSFILALNQFGILWGWGSNNLGQLGTNDTIPRLSPVQLGTSSWTQISAGIGYALGITTTGALFAWGTGTSGKTGLNETINRSSPTQIGSSSWSQVSAGRLSSYGITTDKLLFAWGINDVGQLGDATLINRSSPVQVGISYSILPSLSFNAVSAGNSFVMALDSNNYLWGWGLNSSGQLGNNNTINQSSPYLLSTIKTDQDQAAWIAFSGQTPISWIQVSMGSRHVLAIRNDYKLFAWGTNTNGQVGDGTTVNRLSPTQIGSSSWSQVSAGGEYSMAIKPDGTLWAWGLNTYGPLGIGLTTNRSSPVQVGSSSWASVSASASYTMALSSTKLLYTWGANFTWGQLGLGDVINRSNPTQVGSKSWTQISAGSGGGFSGEGSIYAHAAAIDINGILFTWGNNYDGKLGDRSTIAKSSPVQVTSLLTEADQTSWIAFSGQTPASWNQIAVGTSHVLAIKNNGTLWAWGINENGQLGDSTTITRFSPTQIGTSSWTTVFAGGSHSLGVSNNLLYAWGLNTSGQLGIAINTTSRSSPTQVSVGAYSYISIMAGSNYTLGINNNYTLWAWGAGTNGQLGLGDTLNRSSPTQIGSSSWTQISSISDMALARTTDNLLFGWGLNSNGQLGQNNSLARSSPVQISAIRTEDDQNSWIAFSGNTALSWNQISVGTSHVLAIRNDYKLFGWGINASGQLGDSSTLTRLSPAQIGTSSWIAVSAGANHSLAINSINQLFGWGLNSTGQLGLSNVVSRSSPVQIGSSSWSSVAAGAAYTFAKNIDSLLFGWGLNSSGQLGTNDTLNRSAPTQLGSGSWSQIAVDANTTLATNSNNILFGWGLNSSGQLGQFNNVQRSSPVQISAVRTETDQTSWIAFSGNTAISWTQLSMGLDHGLLLRTDGALYAWGNNNNGQMGLGNLGLYLSPQQVGSSSWSQIAAGDAISAALLITGALFTWGINTTGQLGLGDVISRSSPTQVGTSSWSQIAAGRSHMIGLTSTKSLFVWGTNTDGRVGTGDTLNRSSPTQIGTSSWTQISAGGTNSSAITNDNLLYVWGEGSVGQIGNRNNISRSSPVQVSSIKTLADQTSWIAFSGATARSWNQISVSNDNIFAIGTDGSLWGWGNNAFGQVGLGNIEWASIPYKIGNSSWSQVAAGASFTLGLTVDKKLFAWGYNGDGNLGLNDTITRSSPTQVGSSSWLMVSNHNNAGHTLGITTTGALFGWGNNSTAQLGISDTINRSSPTQIGTSSWSIVMAAAQQTSTSLGAQAAITADKLLYVWGYNSSGTLGQINTLFRSSPVQVTTIQTETDQQNWLTWSGGVANSWSQLAVGKSHTLAIRTDGSLWAWGGNVAGAIGQNSIDVTTSPLRVGFSSWSQIAAGDNFSLGITTNSLLYTWGLNSGGQLGFNDTISRSSPTQVGTSSWTSIGAGVSHALAITANTSLLHTWGINTNGQLGVRDAVSRSSPTQIGTATWNKVFGNNLASSALNSSNGLFQWGSQSASAEFGQVNTLSRSSPVQVSAIRTKADQTAWATANALTEIGWSQISVGRSHTLAIDNLGALWAWGLNGNGQLGLNNIEISTSPMKVGSSSWSAIAADGDFSIAIDTAGRLFSWGNNVAGQLGLGDALNRSSPVQVGAATGWSSIATGTSHSVGIESSLLYTWGLNSSGQLGTANTLARSSPVQVLSDISGFYSAYTWSKALAISTRSGALTSGGVLFTWGTNSAQEAGHSDQLVKSNPVQVQTLKTEADQNAYVTANATTNFSWSQIAAGLSHFVALDSGGGVWCWGRGVEGQLGNPYGLYYSSVPQPVLIDGYYFASSIAAGDNSSYATGNQLSQVYGWGQNNGGQLGTGDTINRSSPVLIGGYYSSIAAGSSHLVYSVSNFPYPNDYYATGFNTSGQLGLGDVINRSAPVQIPGLSTNGTIYAKFTRSGLIDGDNILYMWGSNPVYELGQTNLIARSSPVQVSTITNETEQTSYLTAVGGNAGSWSQISVGVNHALAIRTDGSLWAWGVNANGQLGTLDRYPYTYPRKIGTASWSQVAAGTTFSVAIEATAGGVYTWGQNNVGQLGTGDTIDRSEPTQILGGTWRYISAAKGVGQHAAAIESTTGALYVWGVNTSGQLALNDIINRSAPVQVGTSSFTIVSANQTRTAAITTANYLFTWGTSTNGELGLLNLASKSNPVQVSSLRTEADQTAWLTYTGGTTPSWSQVSVSLSHSIGLQTDGSMWVWGLNGLGQLGTNSTIAEYRPVKLGTSSWSMVAAGNPGVSAAIDTAGRLYTWGNNAVGQLGQSDLINRSSPTQVGTSSWSFVSLTGYQTATNTLTYGITSDKRLFGWGFNGNGNLGIGDVITRSSPVQVGTSSWIMAAGAQSFGAGITTDNLLFTWGWDYDGSISFPKGSLGQRYLSQKSAPVQVTSIVTEANEDSWITYTGAPAKSWSMVSKSASHAMAIRSDGGLYTWGLNSSGQLGLGSQPLIFNIKPVKIGTSSWNQVAAGAAFSLAIKTDGTLWAWGDGSGGKTGLNSTQNYSSPVQIGAATNWSRISAGNSSAAALNTLGALYAWGLNSSGELGLGDTITRSSPVQIGSSSWTQVSVGDTFISAILTTGALFTWGSGANGRLGSGATLNRSSPVQVGTSSWAAISSGTSFALGLTSVKLLYSWGINTNGQLGLGDAINRSAPTQIGSSSWTSVTAGLNYGIGITNANTLWSWGLNSNGQLGLNDTINRSAPTQIGASSFSMISAGMNNITPVARNAVTSKLSTWGINLYHGIGDNVNYSSPVFLQANYDTWTKVAVQWGAAFGIRSDGGLFAWGANDANGGVLGDGTTINKSSPTQIGTSSWSQLSAGPGAFTGVGILTTGALYAWGFNNVGQLGIGDTINRSSPVQIGTSSWSSVTAGYSTLSAIKSNGQLFAWGAGVNNQIDIQTGNYSSPVFITTVKDTWANVALGQQQTAAIRGDKLLFTWGLNSSGQLGDGSTISRSSPVQIGTSSWTLVASGLAATYGIVGNITANGSLYAWGSGTTGVLGLNDSIARSSPVQIGTSSWTLVDATTSNAAAIKTNRQLFVWGLRTSGLISSDLGATAASSPIFIRSIDDKFSKLAIGTSHTAAIRYDNLLYAWGLNSSGQLGTNDILNRSSPTQIGTSSWTFIAAGLNTTFGITGNITANGSLYAWGLNTTGQLGLNDSISRSNPTQIGSSSWVSVASYNINTAAIKINNQLFAWGNRTTGMILNGIAGSSSSPVFIPGNQTAWYDNQVALGESHTVGIRAGDVNGYFGWGLNTSGQLGDSTTVNKSSPTQIGTGQSWTKVYAGTNTTFLEETTANTYVIGFNTSGQLGNNSSISRSSPTQLDAGNIWTAFSNKSINTAAFRFDGVNSIYDLFAWGSRTTAQVEGSISGNASSPTFIRSLNDTWFTTSSGQDHTLALRSDKTLWAWGNNNQGQLGDGTVVAKSSPTQIGSSSWTSIAAGASYSLGITNDSLFYGWGRNVEGQLGNGATIYRSAPTQIGTSSWFAIGTNSVGTTAHGIKTNRQLFAWGTATNLQVGPIITGAFSSPVFIRANDVTWANVAIGESTILAIREDKLLFAWGHGQYGAIGNNSTINRSSPTQVGTSSWTQIIAARQNVIGQLTSNGLIYSWGYNDGYQLGLGDTIARSNPTQVGNTSYAAFDVGWLYVAGGIDTNNQIYLWGQGGTYAVLGDGQPGNIASTPTFLRSVDDTWSSISSGGSHTVGIRSDKLLYAWGFNSTGQLGDSTSINRSSPVLIGSSSWAQVAAGNTHTLGSLASNSTVYAWGMNTYGQLGLSDTINRSSPTQIGTSSWIAFSASVSNSAAINTNRQLFVWGDSTNGQIGNGTYGSTFYYSSPVFIPTVSDTWRSLAASSTHSLAIRQDNYLYAWGNNGSGQVGDNSTINRSVPVQIGGNIYTSGATIAANDGYSMALLANGAMYTWGWNNVGQLGLSDSIDRSNATQVGTSSWSFINAGALTAAAIKTNQQIFLWGSAFSGQIGDGSIGSGSYSSPVFLRSLNDTWTNLVAGSAHSLAIREDNGFYGWGLNAQGQIGNSETVNRSNPVQIANTIASTASIYAGASYSMYKFANGAIYTWGVNSFGALGQNDTVNRSSPVQVGTSSWSSLSAGVSTAAAIKINGQLFLWGNSTWGQIGDGSFGTGYYSSPTFVRTVDDSWYQVAVAKNTDGQTTTGGGQSGHTLGIRADKLLYAWGGNDFGQQGTGIREAQGATRSRPVQVGSSSWSMIEAGNSYSIGIDANNKLYTWGAQAFMGWYGPVNQLTAYLGTSDTIIRSNPTQIGNSSWTQIDAALYATTAIRSDGQLFVWGSSHIGLGTGAIGANPTVSEKYSSPVIIRGVNDYWTSISSDLHTAAIRADKPLYTWGLNNAGQLGTNDTINRSNPSQVGASSYSIASAAFSHTVAITTANLAYGWGFADLGQTGISSTTPRSNPTQIGTSSWSTIAAGRARISAGIRNNQQLFVWGYTSSGQFGNGMFTANTGYSSPVLLRGVNDTFANISGGQSHIAILRSDRIPFVAGLNSAGQLGQLDVINRSAAVQIGTSSWNLISAGASHTMGILSTGALYAWGLGSVGRLGLGDTINRSSPVQVGTSSWVFVNTGATVTGGISLSRQLYMWGQGGAAGAIGDTSYNITYSSPVFLRSVDESWSQITAGTSASNGSGFAIRADKLLFTWGINTGGQLGTTDTFNRSSPTQLGSNSWLSISAAEHVLAIRSDQTLWAWGFGAFGKLGLLNTNNRSSPTQLGSGTWAKVAAGPSNSYGITTSGLLYSWGAYQNGALGNIPGAYPNTNRSSPVQVGSDIWNDVYAGNRWAGAIRNI